MAVGTALAADPPMRILPNALSADPSAFERANYMAALIGFTSSFR